MECEDFQIIFAKAGYNPVFLRFTQYRVGFCRTPVWFQTNLQVFLHMRNTIDRSLTLGGDSLPFMQVKSGKI